MKNKEICLSIKKWAEILKDNDGFDYPCTENPGKGYITLAKDFYYLKKELKFNYNPDPENIKFFDYIKKKTQNNTQPYKFNDSDDTTIEFNFFEPFMKNYNPVNKQNIFKAGGEKMARNISQKWHFFIAFLAFTEFSNYKKVKGYSYRKHFKRLEGVRVEKTDNPNLYKPFIIYVNNGNEEEEIKYPKSYLGKYLNDSQQNRETSVDF